MKEFMMEGIIEAPTTKLKKELSATKKLIKKIEKMTKDERSVLEFFVNHDRAKTKKKNVEQESLRLIDQLNRKAEKLATCAKLEEEFKVVQIDKSAVREIPHPGPLPWKYQDQVHSARRSNLPTPPRPTITCPLIWSAKLPIKQVICTIKKGSLRISTKAPDPIPEAIKLLHEHKDKFDHMEVWWVPNKFKIKVQPPPLVADPILVGAIQIKAKEYMYFELIRWIDEEVEDGWWSHEGY